MNTKRRIPAAPLGQGPTGRNLCYCGCGKEIQGRRLNWFSDACVEAWKIRNDPGTVRRLVEERDRGVCAACGRDCFALERELRRIVSARKRKWSCYNVAQGETPEQFRLAQKQAELDMARWGADMRKAGFKPPYEHLWEADHIIPVVEGGGQCGLENYRTLCLPCHKQATRELRKRLAERSNGGVISAPTTAEVDQ